MGFRLSSHAAAGAVALLLVAVPLAAQVQSSGGVEGGTELGGGGLKTGGGGLKTGGGGLNTGRESGLQGGGGLKTGGGLGSPRQGLQTSRVEAAPRQGAARIEGAKAEPGRSLLSPAGLRKAAVELARGGLSKDQIQGAATSIPESQIGELLYDVALELEQMAELDMTDVAVGYYMAVLADPEGARHGDAKRRLQDILLDEELSHEEAQRLYAQGTNTLHELADLKIGLSPDGLAAARRELIDLKAAYRARRDLRSASSPEIGEESSQETLPNLEDQAETRALRRLQTSSTFSRELKAEMRK